MSFKCFSIYSSGGHFCSAERNDFNNFDRESPKEHFCEIIFKNQVHWSRRRYHFKVYCFFSSCSLFVKRSERILAILVEGHLRNISMKLI